MIHRLAPLFLVLFALLALAPASATAQWGGMEKVVTASGKLELSEAKRGAEVTLSVSAEVDEKYHIYAMDLQYDGFGPVATTIELSEDSAAILTAAGDWKEPEPQIKFDKGFEAEIAKHYGSPVVFTRRFQINPDAEPGEHVITGTMTYQACTEESCLPPLPAEFEVKFTILPGEPVAAAVAAVDPEPAPSTAAPAEPASLQKPEEDGQSLLAFTLASFGFGLLALLTPCVFPMIPITVSFFTNKAAKSTFQAAKYAGIYVFSIIAGFTLIGFGVSLILRFMGAGVESSGFANRIAADPWINLFFAGLYFFFALALLEVFNLSMPSSITNKLNMSAMKQGETVGIAFKAVVFVLISFTCTAPLMGILMVQAIQGEWTRPLFGMLGFSTGLALPFFGLAMAPQLLSSMPKSGSWLYSIKVVMALLVLAAGFKFVSNADLIWLKENMIFTREVLLAIWTAIAAVTGFYLFRIFHLPAEEESRSVGPARLFAGVAFLTIALYLSSGLFGRPLNGWLEAYMPPDLSSRNQVVASEGSGSALPASRTETGGDYLAAGFSWFTDLDKAKQHAREINKPIFIDFTGYTCTNCRLMEKNMFPRPAVAGLLEDYVRVKIYTDDAEKGAERRALQARMFNTISLPFYAAISPDEEIYATEAYTTNEDKFVEFLKSGLQLELASIN